jgi:hypothetical protein
MGHLTEHQRVVPPRPIGVSLGGEHAADEAMESGFRRQGRIGCLEGLSRLTALCLLEAGDIERLFVTEVVVNGSDVDAGVSADVADARPLEAAFGERPPGRIDQPPPAAGQFDSEALWAQVGADVRAGDRVLIVRGGDASGQPAGRDWLAARLEAVAAQVDTAVAYIREVPQWDAGQRERAEVGARQGAWWLFSSSEGVDNLARLLPGQDWSTARALCTHPRIAQAARAAGFGTVATARPGLEDVAAFLQSTV